MTFETFDQTDVWKFFRFLEKISDFLKILIFGKFPDFWKIVRFLEKFQFFRFFGRYSDFWKIFISSVSWGELSGSGHVSSSLWSNISRSQVSRIALLQTLIDMVPEGPTRLGTRSYIELFWTAEKERNKDKNGRPGDECTLRSV